MKKLKIAWLFITCVIGTAQLPAQSAQSKPKINSLPLSWEQSVKQLELL